MAHARELDDERQVGDLVAAADRTGCERTAVIGFCMGGMFALKAAGSGRFDRAVSFYLRTPSGWEIEYGWSGLEVEPETWSARQLVGATSLWVHKQITANEIELL